MSPNALRFGFGSITGRLCIIQNSSFCLLHQLARVHVSRQKGPSSIRRRKLVGHMSKSAHDEPHFASSLSKEDGVVDYQRCTESNQVLICNNSCNAKVLMADEICCRCLSLPTYYHGKLSMGGCCMNLVLLTTWLGDTNYTKVFTKLWTKHSLFLSFPQSTMEIAGLLYTMGMLFSGARQTFRDCAHFKPSFSMSHGDFHYFKINHTVPKIH